MQNLKALSSLYSCAGQFESYLVPNPEDRFSRDVAHISSIISYFRETNKTLRIIPLFTCFQRLSVTFKHTQLPALICNALKMWDKLGFLMAFKYTCIQKNRFCLQWKDYVVGANRNHLGEAVLMNNLQHNCLYGEMSHDMKKPTKWVCAQRRLKSDWADAQSDQSLRCALNG